MNYDLQIVTQVTQDLYENLNAASFTLFHRKKNVIYCSICSAIFLLYYVFVFFTEPDPVIIGILAPVIIGAIAFLFYYRLNTSIVAKRLGKKSIRYANNRLSFVQYTFYSDYLFAESEQGKVQNNYNTISTFAETDDYYFIFMNQINAHGIKKSNLGKSNVDMFRSYMEAKTGLTCKKIEF